MQSFSPFEVGQRYGVTEMTVRAWVRLKAIGANTTKSGRYTRSKITTHHIEEFEQRTRAVPYRPQYAPTRADVQAKRHSGPVPAANAVFRRENAAAARKAPRFTCL